jgi:hypothetical protein
MLDRFDPQAQRDWTSTIALHLTADGGVPEQKLGLYIKDGKVELRTDGLPENADFLLRTKAGTWAGILLGKKRLETALLQRQLHFDGLPREGMKLRTAFRI